MAIYDVMCEYGGVRNARGNTTLENVICFS